MASPTTAPAPSVGILADDLTGSADAAAPFVRRGLSALVERGRPDRGVAGHEVRAFACGARDLAPRPAREALSRGVDWLESLAPRWAFVKIDSTLRGYLELELAIVRARMAPGLTLICPALPSQGRVVRGGDVFVNDQRLGGPPIAARFGLAREATLLGSSEVRSPTAATRDRLGRAGAVAICDALTEEDLAAVIDLTGLATGSTLLVGSAGLAGALAQRLGTGTDDLPLRIAPSGPILLVAGSMNERTTDQLRALERLERLEFLVLSVRDLLETEMADLQADLASTLADGNDVALYARGPAAPEREVAIDQALGRLVAPFAVAGVSLVLTGGATAESVLAHAGVDSFELVGEVEPGIPVARDEVRGLSIVTKAGGFGSLDALRRAIELLRGARDDGNG